MQKPKVYKGKTAHGTRTWAQQRAKARPLKLSCSVNFPFSMSLKLAVIAGIFLALPQAQATPGQSWHPLADIRETAMTFIKNQSEQKEHSLSVTSRALDRRLKLPLCDLPLVAYLPMGATVRATTTVGVRCASPRSWKLFVPVKVNIASMILVSARSLAAGTVISAAEVATVERDITSMHGRYLAADANIYGQVLRRNLQAGQPLRSEMLTIPKLVKRGQRVTISTRGSGINIRMAGTAMSDGHKGQRIHVKNSSSGRVVEGVVVSSDLIEVRLQ